MYHFLRSHSFRNLSSFRHIQQFSELYREFHIYIQKHPRGLAMHELLVTLLHITAYILSPFKAKGSSSNANSLTNLPPSTKIIKQKHSRLQIFIAWTSKDIRRRWEVIFCPCWCRQSLNSLIFPLEALQSGLPSRKRQDKYEPELLL